MLRLTGTERAVAEIAAIAEHVASLSAGAAALGLLPDVPAAPEKGPALVASLDETTAPDAAPTLREIRSWSASALGIDRVPAFWGALAHEPRLLSTTWRKDRLILEEGTLDALVKGCVALAVAEFRQSAYWIAYLSHALRRRHGVDDRLLVEVAGAVMHYVSFNTIAHGMRLEPPADEMTAADVAPGGPLEHVIPGVRRRPPAVTGPEET